MAQLLRERQDLFLPNIFGDRPNLFESNDAVSIYQVTLWRAVNTVVDRNAAISVRGTQDVRVAEFIQPLQRGLAIVFLIHSVNGQVI